MNKSWFSNRNIAVFTLVFMSVQFLGIEGWEVSLPKVGFMALTPLITLFRVPQITKATVLAGAFFVVTLCMLVFQFGSFRSSTIIYSALFLLMFNMYYGLVHVKKVFTLDFFIRVLTGVIKAYFIVLILQQVGYLVGLKSPLINYFGYGVAKFNSLAIEPSHAARILTVFFYGFLKCIEYRNGSLPSIKLLWTEHRRLILMFLYTMLTINSGTAIAGLGILSLYFVRRKYVFFIVPAFFAFYMLIPVLDYEPLNRAMVTFNAALTGDSEKVIQADHSASARVNIILDTFKYLDLSDSATWFGKGVDAFGSSSHAVVSAITDYGLISYIFKLLFFFGCCFTSLFSLEVLIFVMLFSLNIGNVAYGWGALMVFSTVKYFAQHRAKRK